MSTPSSVNTLRPRNPCPVAFEFFGEAHRAFRGRVLGAGVIEDLRRLAYRAAVFEPGFDQRQIGFQAPEPGGSIGVYGLFKVAVGRGRRVGWPAVQRPCGLPLSRDGGPGLIGPAPASAMIVLSSPSRRHRPEGRPLSVRVFHVVLPLTADWTGVPCWRNCSSSSSSERPRVSGTIIHTNTNEMAPITANTKNV